MKCARQRTAAAALFTAVLGLAASPLSAQVTYTSLVPPTTFDTSIGSFTPVQTFTGFGALYDVTWHIRGQNAPTAITAYLAEWDTVNNRTVSSTLAIYGGGEQTPNFNGYGDVTFTETIALNPSTTYALILAWTTSLGGLVTYTRFDDDQPSDAFFGSGTLRFYQNSPALNQSFAFFENYVSSNPSFDSATYDWAITVSASIGSVAPIPEPKTAAAALSAAFVGTLMLRRRRRAA
jgi:hypothetical protein